MDKPNQDKARAKAAAKHYTVKNSQTGETRSVTEQEYLDQCLEHEGFSKPDTAR